MCLAWSTRTTAQSVKPQLTHLTTHVWQRGEISCWLVLWNISRWHRGSVPHPICHKAQGRLEASLQVSRRCCRQTAPEKQWLYDRQVTFHSIEIRNGMLLRNVGLRGKHNLESKWSPDPYVVGKMPNIPVFKIKRENERLGANTQGRPSSNRTACENATHQPG